MELSIGFIKVSLVSLKSVTIADEQVSFYKLLCLEDRGLFNKLMLFQKINVLFK